MAVERTGLIIRAGNKRKLRFVALPNGEYALSSNKTIRGKVIEGKFAISGVAIPNGIVQVLKPGEQGKLDVLFLTSGKLEIDKSDEVKGVTGHLQIWKYYSDFRTVQGRSMTAAQFLEICTKMIEIYKKWDIELDQEVRAAEQSGDRNWIKRVDEKKGTAFKFKLAFAELEKNILSYDEKVLSKEQVGEFLNFEGDVEESAIPRQKLENMHISIELVQRIVATGMSKYIPNKKESFFKDNLNNKDDRNEIARLYRIVRNNKTDADTIRDIFKIVQKQKAETRIRGAEIYQVFANYLVKGINGEPLENKVSDTEEPVILLSPSISPKEAGEMPENVMLVVVSEMPKNSHPLMLLKGNDVNVHMADGEIEKYVSDHFKRDVPEACWASMTMLGDFAALYIGLPQDLAKYHKRADAQAETVHKFLRALSGIERRITGGHRIHVRVEANKIEKMKIQFVEYVPDGIGLVRAEDIPNYKETPLTPKEIADHLLELCEISKETIDGKAYYLPVIVRLQDVSADPSVVKAGVKRRDVKLPEWATNKRNLSGAEWLLSKEGRHVLVNELTAAVLAYLQGAEKLRVMIPYVKTLREKRMVSRLFTWVKGRVLKDIAEGKIVIDSTKMDLANIKAKNIDIPLGIMVENKEAIKNISLLADEADFFSFGLNDIQYEYDLKTIMDPQLAKDIVKVVEESNKKFKPLSTCGNIEKIEELIFLLALGIDAVTVPFRSIPEFSRIIRGLDQATLDDLKGKILKAKSQKEISDLMSVVSKSIQEKGVDQESARLNRIARADSARVLREKYSKVHETKISIIKEVMKVIQGEEQDAVLKISTMVNLAFLNGGHKMGESPSEGVINSWLADPRKMVTFFDEWEMREAIGMKVRCTPYYIYKAPNGKLFGRAIEKGNSENPKENPGALSRYLITIREDKEIPASHIRLDIHYFNEEERAISNASVVGVPITGSPGRYSVTYKANKGKTESFEVFIREENGAKEVYRALEREKLFAAEVLSDAKELPNHAAAYCEKRENVQSLFILDRKKIQELKLGIPNIGESYERDNKFHDYESIDPALKGRSNVRQNLYVRKTTERDLPEGCFLIYGIDNYVINTKKRIPEPEFKNPASLVEFTSFLSEEFKEDRERLAYMEDLEKLHKTIKNMEKGHMQELSDLGDQLKKVMLENAKLTDLLIKNGIKPD